MNKNVFSKVLLFVIIILLSIVIFVYFNQGTNSKQVTIEVENVLIDKKELSLTVDGTYDLNAIVSPSNAIDKKVKWSSNNESVATVDNNGKVKAKNAGTSEIIVTTSNGKTAKCIIHVEKKEILASKITLNHNSLILDVGDSTTLKATIKPSNATNHVVNWSSSNENVATVKNGLVKAINVGNAIITAKTANGKTATCKITINPQSTEVKSIKLNKESANITVGQSLSLKAIIEPTYAINKNISWKSSNEKVATVENGLVKAVSIGNTIITAKTANGKTATCNITVGKNQKYAETYFINVHNTSNILAILANDETYKNGYNNGLSVIIKSFDNKYILIDTGNKNTEVKKNIYEQLKELQKSSNVTIDYMILTHSHGDHIGNAIPLLTDSNVKVNNVIMKQESKSIKGYNKILKSLDNQKKMINPQKEGQRIDVGKYLEMYLFNTSDVYANKTCHDAGEAYGFTAATKNATKLNGKYYYFDGANYPDVKLIGTNTLITKKDPIDKGLNNYFYLYKIDSTRNDCNANANSMGIIIKVKTSEGNRYMYFSGDIDNSGYDISAINGIYGYRAQIIFPIGGSVTISKDQKDGLLSGHIKDLNRVASETNAANNIKKTLGNDLKNITIYQASHHGINNAPDAIKTLNLNRSTVYSIIPNKSDIGNSTNFTYVRTYYYTLSKTKKLYTGGKTKDGVYCSINDIGKTLCNDY